MSKARAGVAVALVAMVVFGAAIGLFLVFLQTENSNEGSDAEALYEGPWAGDETSRLRLIAFGPDPAQSEQWLVALHITLAEGWKTYWRVSGDSGLAPQFDWAGSENVARAEVVWPAPRIFEEVGDRFYGFQGDTIWPIRITPARPEDPVELRLNLRYGICSDVCVPMTTELELVPLDPRARFETPHRLSIEAALARRVRSADLEDMNVEATLGSIDGYRAVLSIGLTDLSGGTVDALLVEGSAGLYFGRSERTGAGQFSVPVEADDPASLRGTPVRITLLNEEGTFALETITQIQ